MKYIIVCGYMGSGSSAVTNLLEEYNTVNASFKSYEHVFLHCPNGVFDLEDKLLKSNNAIRSDEAIKSFRNMMNKLNSTKYWWVGNYRKYLPNFEESLNLYLEEIIDFKHIGKWYYSEYPMKPEQMKRFFKRVLARLTNRRIYIKDKLLYKEFEASFPSESKFYEASKKFIDRIYRIDELGKPAVIDQLILPYHIERLENYFGDDARVIVVERDPRDVYLMNKYIWKKKNLTLPFPSDVKEFCKFYRSIRNLERKVDSNYVLRIKFEDLILNYDLKKNEIEQFLNLDSTNHIDKNVYFDPTISINNIHLFDDLDISEEDLKVIEDLLPEYLYDFDEEKMKLKNCKEGKF